MRQCQDPRVLPALANAERVAAGGAVAAAAVRLALGDGGADVSEATEALADGAEAVAAVLDSRNPLQR